MNTFACVAAGATISARPSLMVNPRGAESGLQASHSVHKLLNHIDGPTLSRSQCGVPEAQGRHNEHKYLIFEDGSATPYYRDQPDGVRADNLLSLPTYVPPFESPD